MKETRNFYSPTEVVNLMNGIISRSKLGILIRENKIPTIKFGRKYLIRASWVDDVMAGKITNIS